jgi:hypothetical protein
MSWAKDETDEIICRSAARIAADELVALGIRRAIEEAARRADEANVQDLNDNGAAATGAAGLAAGAIRAMLSDATVPGAGR